MARLYDKGALARPKTIRHLNPVKLRRL
jgi:hypothetical protein